MTRTTFTITALARPQQHAKVHYKNRNSRSKSRNRDSKPTIGNYFLGIY